MSDSFIPFLAGGPEIFPKGIDDPTDISGIQAWYAARLESFNDDDAVSTWTDQSVNGNDATAGDAATFKTAIINSLAVIRFDGSADYLIADALASTASGTDQTWTLYMVAQWRANASFKYPWSFGSSSSDTPWHAQRSRLAIGFDESFRSDDAGGTAALSPSSDNNDTNAHIFGFIMTAGADCQGRLDGAESWTGNGFGATGAMTVNQFTLGALRRTTVSSRPAIDIAEFVFYDGAISNSERDDLEAYLNDLYAIY